MALPRPLRLGAIVVAVAGIGLSACGDDTASPSTTSVAGVTTTVAGVTTTAPGPGGSTTTTSPAGRVVDYAFRGGNVVGDGRVSVKLGEQLTVRVVSDTAEEVHVHTYDRKVDLQPDVPGQITFTADIPGVHEVELEHSHLHLFSLEVQ